MLSLKKFLLFLFILSFVYTFAQKKYCNYTEMTAKLKQLSSQKNTKLESYGKSFSGKDLWVLKIGSSDKPAILIVAGLDGTEQAGTQMALLLAEKLIEEKNTFYIIPNGNPDAIDAFFDKIKYEKSGNLQITDDNRNGKLADDHYEDLNNDGWITTMRVASKIGNYVENPEDNRLMQLADAGKNQVGTHLVFTEGIDNNKNGLYNEDAGTGVNINKNFAFDYPAFQINAGEYAVSENETRTLMDFIFAHQNIHTIIHFGTSNNLSEPEKYDAKKAKERIIKSWQENDVKVSENITKIYTKNITLKDPPKSNFEGGNFTQTAYYHAGKYAFSTPVWWANINKALDTVKKWDVKELKENKKDKKDKPNEDIILIKWLEQENLINHLVSWKEIKHPDFPNQKVEVGGFAPYIKKNPPLQYLEKQVDSQLNFLKSIYNMLPTHEIVEQNIEKLATNLYRITIKITNKGFMPTYTEINDKLKFTSRIKTEILLKDNQKRVSGKKIILQNALQPNESAEHTWLINGSGNVTITSGCATTGIASVTLELK
jgi:hypothetical protein